MSRLITYISNVQPGDLFTPTCRLVVAVKHEPHVMLVWCLEGTLLLDVYRFPESARCTVLRHR
jgi:hypothetical protein